MLDLHADADAICALFAANAIFAYPTEAVFGIGGKPCAQTYQKIIRLKGRDSRKGVIIVAASWAQAAPLLGKLSPVQWDALRHWEADGRATTFILPAAKNVPKCLRDAANNRIAVRVSRHPHVRSLCELCNSPLISTSANPSGTIPATTQAMVRTYFPHLPIVAGVVGEEKCPSRIVDLFTQSILRH